MWYISLPITPWRPFPKLVCQLVCSSYVRVAPGEWHVPAHLMILFLICKWAYFILMSFITTIWDKSCEHCYPMLHMRKLRLGGLILFFLILKIWFVFRERGREGEREEEKHRLAVGAKPTAKACALSGNQTSEPPWWELEGQSLYLLLNSSALPSCFAHSTAPHHTIFYACMACDRSSISLKPEFIWWLLVFAQEKKLSK